MNTPSAKNLGAYIDYSLFAPDATRADIEKICAEARAKNYHSLCVNGSRVELARTALDETNVQVVALVGFPLGASDTDAKRYETEVAVDSGAQEIEFVINIGRLKDGDRQFILREMRDIAEAADERPVKAVLETHLLTRDETIVACQLALDSGIHFVATSTDFQAPAVTLEEIRVLRETLGEQLGIKAAGQIRDIQAAQAFIDAGANRVGISAIAQAK
ncbi:MAG TPA: deoxyribose-phosphate aldolase [Verrucomicrobiae bacterium]|nr:deoxyribose-phosphate aldolase [Verrucomicrobiae bacterium]